MTTAATQTPTVINVAPETLGAWLAGGDTVLIDVREDFEHAAERIEGAIHHPLSKFDAETLRHTHAGNRVVFHCKSGKRSTDAALRFALAGESAERVFHLAGGIDGWIAADHPTIKPATGPRISVMRQVQIVAGGLVALGVLLGVAVSPWFLLLSAFVGCGLMFAGFTGWCGLAFVLAAMPWNKSAAAKPRAASCCTA